MTGHFMAEDSLCEQTKWSGDVMSHYQLMHWPGVDKLSRHIEQVVTIKQVASVVDQLQKERSFCEVFGCVGGQVSFFHRKWIADWQAALGISFVNHHLSLYSMRGERKRDYPANLFYQQPWWEDERGFS
ncbi:MAG TPA: glycoside hydrolase, partial [Armatimonadetes bacterium]|nr:glycoside hydrolase [Armatimonadota bacterium]